MAGLHRKGDDESPEVERTPSIDEQVVSEPVLGADTATDDRTGDRFDGDLGDFTEEELEEAAEALGTDSTEDDAPPPEVAADDTARPAGKRRTVGVRQPDDLDSAETAAGAGAWSEPVVRDEPGRAPAGTGRGMVTLVVALGVIVLLLAATGVFFLLLTSRLTGEVDGANEALTDSAGTSEVVGKLTTPIEKVFSYNYTDLAATEKAADDALIGKARCEYDQLFAKLREQVPAQKLIVTLKVRTIGVSRLSGDDAELFVFADQSTTRTDQNQTAAGGAQFGVVAQRVDGNWKIADFVMFDQPPLGAEPGQTSAAPTC